MVFNEMYAVPSNGFGSPTSPPELFRECQQVPSPSQFSDPSSSPPSMHSPAYNYCPDPIEKMDLFLKEEPRSPPNGNFVASFTAVPTHMLQQQQQQQLQLQATDSSSHQQLQQEHQQQLLNQQQMQQQSAAAQYQQQVLQVGKVETQFQNSEEMGVDDAWLQLELCSNPELFANLQNAVDGILKEQASQQFQVQQIQQPQTQHVQFQTQQTYNQQQQSTHNQQQQSTQQQQQQQPQQMMSTEQHSTNTLTNIATPNSISPPHQDTPSQVFPHNSTNQPSVANGSHMSTNYSFKDVIDELEIKLENDVESNQMTNNAMGLWLPLMTNILDEAGLSYNPNEWSAKDVCAWLQKSVDAWKCNLTNVNLSIDGPTLLSVSPAQFAELVGSPDGGDLKEILETWLNAHKETSSKPKTLEQSTANLLEQYMQQLQFTDQEMQSVLKQMDQRVTSPPILSTSVINHNQLQDACTPQQIQQRSQQQQQQSQHAQSAKIQDPPIQQFLTYQQQQSPSMQRQMPPNSTNSPLAHFQLNNQQQSIPHLRQSLPLQQHTATTSTQQPRTQPQVRSQLQVPTPVSPASPAHLQSPSPSLAQPPSPVDGQKPLLVQSSPSSTKASTVSLQEGAKCYLDDTGVDLAALLAPSQHPTTLDSDIPMDSEEEHEEEVPSTGISSGRTHIQLWQFLKELLANNKKYGSCIRWLDRHEAIFKIEDSVRVATLWGERKNRPQMNYDKLSRSIRQYYNKNIMKKTERSQRLVYQFCFPYGQ